MSTYKGANYQIDFINYLQKRNNIYFYGPGFDHYSEKHNLDDVLSIFDNKPKIIFVGHSWLNDKEGDKVELNNKIDLRQTRMLKLFFLNKEYVNLKEKLDYCKNNFFDLSFSHHHNAQNFSQITNSKYYFIPFAFDKFKFKKIDKNIEKKYDIGFSGIVQNVNRNSGQTDIRRRITKKLYYSIMDLTLIQKDRNLNLFWNIIPQNNYSKKIAEILKFYRYFNIDDYIKKIFMSKIYINTLSPYQLISPRYFETFASGSILLCEETNLYNKIFDKELKYFTFKNDLSDFKIKIEYILSNFSSFKTIIEQNKKNVYQKHTWENRVNQIMTLINKY